MKDGLSQEEFERSRDFVSKYVMLLTKTKNAELGYKIDSMYYGIPDYVGYIRTSLAKMTRDDVNDAIRKHLRADRLQIVAVSQKADELKSQLTSEAPSPMTYNSLKPTEILEEDKIVQSWKLNLRSGDVQVVPVDRIFE